MQMFGPQTSPMSSSNSSSSSSSRDCRNSGLVLQSRSIHMMPASPAASAAASAAAAAAAAKQSNSPQYQVISRAYTIGGPPSQQQAALQFMYQRSSGLGILQPSGLALQQQQQQQQQQQSSAAESSSSLRSSISPLALNSSKFNRPPSLVMPGGAAGKYKYMLS
ncbi:hypothetical protein, conserved [Eimeria praecox]|uniref:Uncharacterized protein n=1 Tax=Eimeria praecox TaxID=51316 RepID=U6H7R3_9EIME|nr:hypothetical protein, conserved [Eimeria praecox]